MTSSYGRGSCRVPRRIVLRNGCRQDFMASILRGTEGTMGMSRPFFSWRIQDLEAELAERRDDVEFLRALIHELGFRSTDRASRLKAQATEALARTQGPPPPSPRAAETSARPSPLPREPVRP